MKLLRFKTRRQPSDAELLKRVAGVLSDLGYRIWNEANQKHPDLRSVRQMALAIVDAIDTHMPPDQAS